jgi:hypothetical protein
VRLIASQVLLGVGIVTLGVCLVFGATVVQGYQRAVAKDDFAGFSLGVFFHLYGLVPLTLSLFVGAALLDPPAWLLRRLGMSAPASKSILKRVGGVLCLVGAAVILLYVVLFVGQNLVHAARHYGHGARGLAMVLLQNLVLSSPLLILSALLTWAGPALRRQPRPLDDD